MNKKEKIGKLKKIILKINKKKQKKKEKRKKLAKKKGGRINVDYYCNPQ
jgi:hypothetical protein